MVLEPLDLREHTNQGRYALCCNPVNYAVVAGLGVIGTNDCGLLELLDLVKGEAFVEALGYGAPPMSAAILFPCDEAILFHMVHHFTAHKLVELIKICFKQQNDS